MQPIATALSPGAMVGREAELASLLTAQRAAARGRGSIVLISGDAGIGKTRLLHEFRTKVATRAHFITGNCTEFAAHPLGPFLEALRPIAHPVDPGSERDSREEQFAEFFAILLNASERRTLVLLLEDIHWADEASLQLLLHIGRFVARARILVVCTVRTDDLRHEHPALPYVARLTRVPSLWRIELAPLPLESIADILRGHLPAGVTLPLDRLHDIAERAEGNPFFAEELLRAALGTATLARNLPLSIRALISERFAQLTPQAREVIVQAAVIGREFEAALLADVLEAPIASVLGAVCEARDLQLLDEVCGGSAYRFRHALVREALYEQLLLAQARPLHARIARALLRSADPEQVAIDLGYHYLAARDAAPALYYNEVAGGRAEALYAHEDAFRLYGRALEATGIQDFAARGRLLAKSARAISAAGFLARASDYYTDAIAAYHAAGMFDEAGELAWVCASSFQVQGRLHEAVQRLDAAIAAHGPGPSHSVKGRLALIRAFAHCDQCDPAAAQQALAQAHALRAMDDPRLAHSYYNVSLYVLALTGERELAQREFDAYFAAAERLGDDVAHAQTCISIAANSVITGFDAAAERAFAAALPIVRERNLKYAYRALASSLAMFHLRSGRLAEARKITETIVPRGDSLMNRFLQCVPAVAVGTILADDDLVNRSEPWAIVEDVLRTGNNMWIGRLCGMYSEYLWHKRHFDEATNILSRAVSALRHPMGAHETLLAAARFGDKADRVRARAVLDIGDSMPDAIQNHAASALFDAICAGRDGRFTVAADAGMQARELYARLGWKYYEALALEAAGEREEALALLRDCGAIRDVRRIQLDAGTQPAPAGLHALELTTREREIAALIVDGASNREIAAQLGISQKTVEKHITAIFEKFGLRSRAQLVVHMMRGER